MATSRLRLRPWNVDDDADVAALHRIQGDPRVVWWGHARDLAASRAVMINRQQLAPPPLGAWAIELIEPASAGPVDVVGTAVLFCSDLGTEIGWHVRHDRQRHGIAGEAAAMMWRHAQAQGITDVVAAIVPVNFPSQRVAQRLGFVVDGSAIKGGLFHELWKPPASTPR